MSNIEWTDKTWEVTAGCTKVSRGCTHCYAETLVGTRLAGVARKRAATGQANGSPIDLHLDVVNNRGQWNGNVVTLEANLGQPLRRREPTTYFVNSRSDLFHPDVPFEFIDRVFAVMALCPRHTFQVLTKRPERMAEYLSAFACASNITTDDGEYVDDPRGLEMIERIEWVGASMIENGDEWHINSWPLPNVWLGTSVEDHAAAELRIPHLLRCPAAVRFLSCEPLLGPLALPAEALGIRHQASGSEPNAQCPMPDASLHWVIVGGESGSGARPCEVAWIRSVVEQCKVAGVACFVKQLGANPSATLAETGTDETDHDNIERLELRDKKGGDPGEWPVDLVVREVPEKMALGTGH